MPNPQESSSTNAKSANIRTNQALPNLQDSISNIANSPNIQNHRRRIVNFGTKQTKIAIDVYPEHVLGRHVARYVAVLLVYLPRLLCVTYRMSSLAYVYNACTVCLLQTCPDAFGVRE